MMKMYHHAQHGGGAPFWEAAWSDGQLEEAIRFCAVDPLRPLFERYAPAGTALLEGGCGRGQYVVYYAAGGVRVTGLDFAAGALGRLKTRSPSARLCLGDVAALPFREASYDAYYSGGVVEHFEAGPLPALREAHRVLRPGGVLLASVPYLSPLRRLSALWRGDRRFVPKTREDAEKHGKTFWQYAFGVREFTGLLEGVGFRVDRTFPYAVLYGLYDLPLLPRLLARKPPAAPIGSGPTRTEPVALRESPSLFKRLVVSEDRSVPALGLVVEVAGRLCANMMMYVATKPAA
jgi:SAM-dependent methyltransferase